VGDDLVDSKDLALPIRRCAWESLPCARAAQAVGDDLVDSIVSDNIPILTEAEKFNETLISSVKRVRAHLLGAPRAAAPRAGAPAAQRWQGHRVQLGLLAVAPSFVRCEPEVLQRASWCTAFAFELSRPRIALRGSPWSSCAAPLL